MRSGRCISTRAASSNGSSPRERLFDLVRKNLFRRKLRAILMIVSILVAFMIFGVLAGFYRAFNAGEDRAAADR